MLVAATGFVPPVFGHAGVNGRCRHPERPATESLETWCAGLRFRWTPDAGGQVRVRFVQAVGAMRSTVCKWFPLSSALG